MRPPRLLASIAILLASCQQGESRRHEAPPPPAPVAAPKPKKFAVDGISVEVLDNGEVRLLGKDRWDKPVDTTYENIEFLRDALPVLARTLTPAQTERIRAFVVDR